MNALPQPIYRFIPSKTVGRHPAQGRAFEVQAQTHANKWDIRGWVQQPTEGGKWSGLTIEDSRVGSYGRWGKPGGSRIGAWHFAEIGQYENANA